MKRLVGLALAMLCWVANAQNLGVVITGFKILTADRVELYYAKVQASGRDFEAAKHQAFRLAVEQAVGSVILSETEMRNNHITRDEIVSYSSGFVDRYNILSRTDVPGKTELVMEVWIAQSSIANRLLAKNTTEKSIDGERLATQYGTIIDERTRGDRLLQTVLNDHPRRSFTVKFRQPEVTMDTMRNLMVGLTWEVHWADEYYRSLQETVKQFHVGSWCWSNCPQRFGLLGYAVADIQKVAMVYNRLARTELSVRITVNDIHDNVIFVSCVPIDVEGVMITAYNDNVSLPNKYLVGTQRFSFGKNPQDLNRLSKFNGQVMERSKCQ